MTKKNKQFSRATVQFRSGKELVPRYAALLPNRGFVLLKAGLGLGLSAIITVGSADEKSICYLEPTQYAQTRIFLYENGEIRDSSGRFFGQFIGHANDNFAEYIYSGEQDNIFILHEEKIIGVSPNAEMFSLTSEELVRGRLKTESVAELFENKILDIADGTCAIYQLAEFSELALRAALELKKYRKYDVGYDKSYKPVISQRKPRIAEL